MEALTVGSLCSGIGGLELGLERAGGFRTVWQVEKDDYCRRVLAKHWPDVRRYAAVEDVGASGLLQPVDLVCAGFPCQPVSSQGHKRGDQDERWLWPEIARVVREIRPDYLLLENTAGLATRGLGEVLGDLAGLRYDAEWQSLSPCYLGAPHHRGRLFVLAYPHSVRRRRVHQQPAVFHAEAARRWWAGEPPRRGRAETWRDDPEGLLRPSEPEVGRVADGFPRRLDRLRALGNAVVPQVAEWIGRRILEHHDG